MGVCVWGGGGGGKERGKCYVPPIHFHYSPSFIKAASCRKVEDRNEVCSLSTNLGGFQDKKKEEDY